MMTFLTENDVLRRPYFIFAQHRAEIPNGVFYTLHKHDDGHPEAARIYASSDARARDDATDEECYRMFNTMMSDAASLLSTGRYDAPDFAIVASSTTVRGSKDKLKSYLEALAGGHHIPLENIQIILTLHHPHLKDVNKMTLTFRQYFAA